MFWYSVQHRCLFHYQSHKNDVFIPIGFQHIQKGILISETFVWWHLLHASQPLNVRCLGF